MAANFRSIDFLAVLMLLIIGGACVKKTVPTGAPAAQKSAGQDTAAPEDPEDKNKCRLASLRHCSDVCDGVYGMMCSWGQACNPVQHYCEKAEI